MNERRPHILAIDDTPGNLVTLGRVLSNSYDLQIATSGEQGLALAAALPPDLILLDVMMPGMDGYETCRRLKADAVLKDIPVIFVTALSESSAETAGLALGAADYLTKPINVEVALHRIGNLIEREQLRKQIRDDRDHLEDVVMVRTAALSVAKESAENASRAKTIFLATMSHELRTPLNAVVGMVSLAIRRASDDKQVEQLNKALNAALHLTELVSSILDFSKIEADRLTLDRISFRLGDVIDHSHQLILPLAQTKALPFVFEVPDQLANCTLIGDPMRLGQVLFNLIGNAVKFTSAGNVVVSVTSTLETVSDVRLRFDVRDTGIGIDPKDQQRIFDYFDQLDGSFTRKYGGAGLGLAICKRLVGLMGGEIGVESALGEGSHFWFSITLNRASSEFASKGADDEDSVRAQIRKVCEGKRALVCSEEPMLAALLHELLSEVGFVVDGADDEASVLTKAMASEYSLVCLALRSTNPNDTAIIQAIRAQQTGQDIPILAISLSGRRSDQASGTPVGICDWLDWPIDPVKFWGVVRTWTCQKLLTDPAGIPADRAMLLMANG